MDILTVLFIAAGTTISAGCSPDRACWPEFITDRPAQVYVTSKVPHAKYGEAMGSCLINCEPSATGIARILVKQPKPSEQAKGWNVNNTIAHELGHMTGVTKHAPGVD